MLLAEYDSSDDEAPVPGPSHVVEDKDDAEDDAAIAAAAATDAFGLASSGETPAAASAKVSSKLAVSDAPDVLKEDPNTVSSAIITRPTDQVINVNITYEDMMRPVEGPVDPFNQKKNAGMNSLSGELCRTEKQLTFAGHVEEQAMENYEFSRQQRTFDVHGYAMNPSLNAAGSFVGSAEAAAANGYQLSDTVRSSKAATKAAKRKRAAKGDASIVEGTGSYKGPWAGYEDESGAVEEEDEEENEEWRAEKRRREEAKAAAQERNKIAREEKSIFHGKSLTDYAGRTYMHIPTDVDVKLNPAEGAPPPNTYVPDQCVHTWTGHSKGVSAIRLFPKSGHLLLSGSMDTKIKVSLNV
jgi:pre-mRNA-processing factor 17